MKRKNSCQQNKSMKKRKTDVKKEKKTSSRKSPKSDTKIKKGDSPHRISASVSPKSIRKGGSSSPKSSIKKETAGTSSGRSRKYVGAHVSISGGLYKAVLEAVDIGAKAFGMFLKSQRQWASKPLDDTSAERFRETCKEYGFAPHMIVPHGSYLMNCGSPDAEILKKSQQMLTDELKRCEKLGLALFNFHPGSTCGKISVDECIRKIAKCINHSHAKTKYVITVIENMSCQGNTIGGNFSELGSIIDQVKDKARIGVCLDTCHAFAAGYDLSTEDGFEEMMKEFKKHVGFKYLKAIHINDSKGVLGCHADRHENIGRGKIGLAGFRRIMNEPKFNNIPFVLETPECDYSKEIKKLYSLCKI